LAGNNPQPGVIRKNNRNFFFINPPILTGEYDPPAACRAERAGTMAKRSSTYIWQFTIGLGFISGIWTAIGIDPREVILNLLGSVTGEIFPDPAIRQIFLILPAILLIISVWGAYRKGKSLGLASVLIAYVAGLSILVALWTSLILLLAAIVTGYLATGRRW
jgi:hypothetical protein